MIDGLLFDKDGTLFDFRISWGQWAAGFLSSVARDGEHAEQLGRAIGFDAALLQPFLDIGILAAVSRGQQRRHQIVGDCRQLKMDVDSYNQNRTPDQPIQMIFDFTYESGIQELRNF